MQISGDSAAARPGTNARVKCVYFLPSTPTTVSFLLASRSIVSIMELTRSPINLDVYMYTTLYCGVVGQGEGRSRRSASARARHAIPVKTKR